MIVSPASTFPLAGSSIKRTDASQTVTQTDDAASVHNTAQFAAFLSMLVGSDPKLRSSLIKQLPGDGSDLLDHLLSGADQPSESGEGLSLGELLSAKVPANVDGNAAAPVQTLAVSVVAVPMTAEGVRYGMMTDTARSAAAREPAVIANNALETDPVGPAKPRLAPPTNVETPPADAPPLRLTRAEVNSINRARMAEVLGSMQFDGASTFGDNGLNNAKPVNRFSQTTLARISSRKLPATEELVAMGDLQTARFKVGLDSVLAKSGTEEGMLLAASHAASVALGAALAASAADVNTPIKDVEALDPELRTRLERVIGRMKQEFGHDVTIVETARSQERQDVLYAQGRSTPGSTVTNTLDSKHTQGEAVDVLIDGDWGNQKGFARLQQVAKEEGLKTLGMSDPGHLELPKDSWTKNADVRVTDFSASAPVASGIARVATVARVASVGAGMPIAQTPAGLPAAQTPSATVNTNGAAGLTPQPRDGNSQSNSQSTSDSSNEPASRKATFKPSDKADPRGATPVFLESPTDTRRFVGPVDDIQKPSGVSAADAVERIQDISALREQQGAKPLSHITMDVENPDGTSQQVRVDVRGNTVATSISTDSTNADRLRTHANELKTGLESRGLESDSVRISAQNVRPVNAADAVTHNAGAERDTMRLTGAGMSGNAPSGDQPSQQGMRDRSSGARDWESKQSTREEQRAQNRDAQGRGSGNQDRQRPQYQEQK